MSDHYTSEYYFNELSKIDTSEISLIKIKSVSDETKWLDLNEESIPVIIGFLISLNKELENE